MQKQVEKFIQGKNSVNIVSSVRKEHLTDLGDYNRSNDLDTVKFIPASGAATRMFSSLYVYLEDNVETEYIQSFFKNIQSFAFYNALKLSKCTTKREIVKTLLDNYGNLPKALIKVHKYPNKTVTPIEEHIYEGLRYCNENNLHFTISKEHEELFSDYVKDFDMNITYSFQKESTNTIAVDLDNNPIILEDGSYLSRPGGHGALIENLNDIDTDVIFIKNIDNVCHQSIVEDTILYKKKLMDIGLNFKERIEKYINDIIKNNYNLKSIEDFIRNDLNINYKKQFTKEVALKFLNRPLRVCGVVKNQGEPGGGPFIVDNGDYTDLQIVEMSEIDLSKDRDILEQSQYFNPVDIVCFVKDYQGNKFNLLDFINQDRYFISEKTYKGKKIKALEHPGLWNGATHHWNTLFVEVPLTTFNPIKTVNDLLRDGHLGKI